ncbi:Golgi-associated plant pathogenesis-related protein 1-like [Littorina saxatilis]|uniref:SCP domain-containing protein n=1 Tax=Littorina saxatilis TaxID=31220 RepID=A0AAN9AXL6_9CAEN
MTTAEIETFRTDMLAAHNQCRVQHGSPELAECEDLHRSAQSWADTLADTGFLQYNEAAGVGESIVFVDVNGQRPCGQQVTDEWYRESRHYSFNQPRWRKETIHFTQLVWKTTTQMGVGVSRVRGQDRWVIVTHYRPQGNTNMPGDFKKNVQPPT